jgi:ATP-dependent exoDNAse (exonuclease V) beta subunit
MTATEWAGGVEAGVQASLNVETISFDRDPGRPSGTRYGTLVHAVMATAPLDADRETLARIAATQGRIAAATDAEVQAAVATVRAVLAHPLFEAARRAVRDGRCRRETPVTLVVDETLVEGVVDFAFDEGGTTRVIDFKTDRAEGDALLKYQRQVALYADAIAQATGRPARAVLMQI